MKLVVIIPALNEEKTIGSMVARVPKAIPGIESVEVLVVDDGSTDVTPELARAAGADVVSHPRRQGVGAAFATGIDAALRHGADIIVNMDGDAQFSPEDIPTLIAPIQFDHYGFVTCTRFADPALMPRMPWIKRWGNGMMTRLINWVIWGAHFTDVSCGFRAYTRDTALKMNLFGRFSYTQESFIDLAGKNVRMTEVPLRVRGVREFGESRVAKSLWHYASKASMIILRAMRDTRPLKFFGGIGLAVLLIAMLMGLFVLAHWLSTGRTHPYQSLVPGSSALLLLGFLLCVLGMLADMLGRNRKTLEEIRYYGRKTEYGPSSFELKQKLLAEGQEPAELSKAE